MLEFASQTYANANGIDLSYINSITNLDEWIRVMGYTFTCSRCAGETNGNYQVADKYRKFSDRFTTAPKGYNYWDVQERAKETHYATDPRHLPDREREAAAKAQFQMQKLKEQMAIENKKEEERKKTETKAYRRQMELRQKEVEEVNRQLKLEQQARYNAELKLKQEIQKNNLKDGLKNEMETGQYITQSIGDKALKISYQSIIPGTPSKLALRTLRNLLRPMIVSDYIDDIKMENDEFLITTKESSQKATLEEFLKNITP